MTDPIEQRGGEAFERVMAERPPRWRGSLSRHEFCFGYRIGMEESEVENAKLREDHENANECLAMVHEALEAVLGKESMKNTPAMMYPEAIIAAVRQLAEVPPDLRRRAEEMAGKLEDEATYLTDQAAELMRALAGLEENHA